MHKRQEIGCEVGKYEHVYPALLLLFIKHLLCTWPPSQSYRGREAGRDRALGTYSEGGRIFGSQTQVPVRASTKA